MSQASPSFVAELARYTESLVLRKQLDEALQTLRYVPQLELSTDFIFHPTTSRSLSSSCCCLPLTAQDDEASCARQDQWLAARL